MTVFKTLDVRGHSFFNALEMVNTAFKQIQMNGMLEIILDKKRNFLDAYQDWASSKGYKTSDIEENSLMIRWFLKKCKKSK